MKKLIAIIFMFIIASNSYYGIVNDKGEKVTDIQEVLKEQNLITNEIVEEQENETIEQENIAEIQEVVEVDEPKIEETPVTTQTEIKPQSVKTQENKQTVVETKTITQEKQETPIQEKTKQETKSEIKVQEPETPKCSDTKHGVGVGNSNIWFNSYNEAVAYYDNLINGYSDQVHNGEITPEEYNKQCPYGYEIWSCPYCNKWTLNYYFR